MVKEIKKKKTIALKTTTSKNNESEESDEEEEEEDLALIIRKFKRFMKQGFKKKTFKGEPSKEKEKENEKELSIYFECKKSGHVRMDCPLFKKSSKKFKKKTMMAT